MALYCSNCGAKVSDQDAFCYRCGYPLSKQQEIPENKAGRFDSPADDEDSSYILLEDENGKDNKFEFLDLIEYQNRSFIVLLPAEDNGDDDGDMVVILEVKNSDTDYESYVAVENQSLLNRIFTIFKDRNKDVFNFTD